MTHFLRALAQRTVAPAREGQLQPRLASRFEAGPASAGGSTARHGSGPTTADDSLRPQVDAPDLSGKTESHSPAADSVTPGSRSHPNPSTSTAASPTPTIPSPPVQLGNATVFPFLGTAPKAATFSSAADRWASAPFASTLLVEPGPARTHAIAPAPPSDVAPSSARFGDDTGAQLRPRSELASTVPASASLGAAHPASAASSLPTAPSIRVHIGRVDIRAIQPSPAPATPSVPSERRPLLPLDAYLQRRDSP